MTTDSYHSDFGSISKTMLGHFVGSVEDFYHYYIAQDMKTPAPTAPMVVGTVLHEVLLEKKNLHDVCAVWPASCLKKNDAINPKPAADMRRAYPSINFVKADVYAEITGAINAVMNHQLGELIRDPQAVFEKPFRWTHSETGLPCRCRPDFMLELDDRIIIYDLKVTEQIRPSDFNRIARRLMYWLQDAHYSNCFASTGKPVSFRFWLVEPKFPYRISPREYSPTSRSNAFSSHSTLMRKLSACYANDRWTDEWTRTTTYIDEVSPWDTGVQDDELEGFDQ